MPSIGLGSMGLVPVLARLSLRRTRSILLGVGFRLVVSGISLGFPSLVL